MLVSQIDANTLFRKGEKVSISRRGLQAQMWRDVKEPIAGQVVGFSRKMPHCIRLLRKGRKKPELFAWWFWERAGVKQGPK